MIEVPVTQDHGFDGGKVDAQLPGVPGHALTGEAGVEQDRVLLFPGKDPDKAGEPVLGKDMAAGIKREPAVHGSRGRYKDIDVVVDKDGHFHPVGGF
jgi:hypothetical protein